MKNKIIKFSFFFFLFLFGIYFTYYLTPIVDDELFNYGYSKSILEGLIPYNDFNMIVPYTFHLILSLFILILGKKLIVYHIVINLIIISYTYICYKKIGKGCIIIYALSYYYPFTYYNMVSLLLLFILFYLLDKNENDKYLGIIISLMFLNKQTLGLLLIPYLYYSKNKLKSIIYFTIPILIFCLLLIVNNSFFNFVDYCFLGMFDFSSKNNNGINFLLILEIIIIFLLIICLFKYKKKDIFYVLMFQIIVFPIVNTIHFFISFIPIVYLFIKYVINKNTLFLALLGALVFSFMIFNYVFVEMIIDGELTNYKENNFMHNRYIGSINYVDVANNYINKYKDYDVYIFGTISYVIKLNLDMPINKYDNINNGNMGYKGDIKYIKEIDNNCKTKKCLFIASGSSLNKNSQINENILNYIEKNYSKILSGNIMNIYITKK